MPNSFANVKAVFEQRGMYEAVVEAGYMAHHELATALAELVSQQSIPLRIVDLGCGDAWLATNAFRNANVASYRGVDVSESSIEQAQRTRLFGREKRKSSPATWPTSSMRSPMPATLVLASYSIHHFSSEAKVALIAACHRALVPGGTFIWIDAVRNDDESRDAYITRLTRAMHDHWTALTPDERDRACTHVRESDFPETRSWMLEHVEQAGFRRAATILDTEFFDGWAFASV